MDIRIYDIENLPLGTRVTLVTCDGLKYPAVVFGNRFGFGNGSYMEMEICKEKIWLYFCLRIHIS